MKKTVVILISFMILSSGFVGNVDTNSKMKAVFIMNFTKLIEWPTSYRKGNFVIGVIGETPLYSELIKMAKTKKVANQPLQIKKFNTSKDIDRCHILFVSSSKSKDIYSIIKKVRSNSTLIITAKEGLVNKGSGISFVIKNNRQKFELNKKNIEKYKLKVSSTLEVLAVKTK